MSALGREDSHTQPRRWLTLVSVVSMSMILVTGMSGTGKSAALAELGRRGYRVVDTDDPGWREYREYVESSDEVTAGSGSGSRKGSPGCWTPMIVARSSFKGA